VCSLVHAQSTDIIATLSANLRGYSSDARSKRSQLNENRLTGKCHTSRSEAAQIPTLLVGSKSIPPHESIADYYNDIEDDQEGGTPYDNDGVAGGYYSDGAYVAAPPIGPQRPPSRPTAQAQSADTPQQHQLLDADTAFHASLVRRFRAHRSLLRQQLASSTGIPDLQPISSRHLLESPPNILQLAGLNYDSTFALLLEATQLVQERISRSRMQLQRLGVWVWALLAKVEELGTLSSEEVGFVRDLGKAAIDVIRRRVMGEDEVEGMRTKRHDEEDMRKVDYSISVASDSGYAGTPTNGHHLTTMSVDATDRGRPVRPQPHQRRRNSSSDVSELAIELNPPRTPSPPSQAENDEQESLEMARKRLLDRVAGTAAEEQQRSQESANDGLKDMGAPALTASADEEDGEVIENESIVKDVATKDITVKAVVQEEASDEGEEQQLKQMNAMLDMILTIVGEEYGQRDLLVARDVLWDI